MEMCFLANYLHIKVPKITIACQVKVEGDTKSDSLVVGLMPHLLLHYPNHSFKIKENEKQQIPAFQKHKGSSEGWLHLSVFTC